MRRVVECDIGKNLSKEGSWESSNKDSLYREGVMFAIKNNWFMAGIIRMRYKKNTLFFVFKFFQCCLIIYQCYNYLSVSRIISLFYEYEISIINSFLVHRITFCSEKEIFFRRRDNLGRYWNLCFNIFFCEDGHTTCNRSDKGNIFYLT